MRGRRRIEASELGGRPQKRADRFAVAGLRAAEAEAEAETRADAEAEAEEKPGLGCEDEPNADDGGARWAPAGFAERVATSAEGTIRSRSGLASACLWRMPELAIPAGPESGCGREL